MVRNDEWIIRKSLSEGMIEPFEQGQISKGVISYGVSSYGYDMRVDNEFKIFTNVNNTVIDPKNFEENNFVTVNTATHIVVPPNSFALAKSIERFKIPRDVIAICIGKSSYARCGILVGITPLEPCFSDDTEILTYNGWKLIKDVEIGESVLGVDSKGIASLQPVLRKQEYDYEGKLLHFDGRSVDLMVTPDHRLYVGRRNPQKNTVRWLTLKATDVFGKHNYKVSRRVVWDGDCPDYITINGDSYPSMSFMRFFGHWLGDGSAYTRNRERDGLTCNDYIIKLACFKERKLKAFETSINACGLHATRIDTGYSVSLKLLCLFLKNFGGAINKRIPRRLLQFHPKLLNELLLGLMESDGCSSTNTIKTISKQLADDIQEIAFKTGNTAIIRKETVSDMNKNRGAEDIQAKNDVYIVRIVNRHIEPKIKPEVHKTVSYIGQVYDITVPNHLVFVRRNGKACWSGNCWEGTVTIEISNTTPLPAKIYAYEGIAQVLFFKAEEVCFESYADKKGKYQGQTGITLPKVK
jgi:dCTP deaminase